MAHDRTIGRAGRLYRRRWVAALLLAGVALVPAGPVPAAAAAPHAPLGMNLAGIASWSTETPFVDAFHTARPWISNADGAAWGEGPPLDRTPEGWVASLQPGQVADTVLLDGGGYPEGDYTIRWSGSGTLGFTFDPLEVVSRAPHRIVVRPDLRTGLWLRIAATDPADPIRDIRVLLPGFGDLPDPPLFLPRFVDRLAGFRTLRFMDWMMTNDPVVGSGEAGRALMSDATWMRRGVPMEAVAALANRLGAEPWITVPHGASDAQARALLLALDGALDPDLRIWIEWSNETWNPAFPQAAYAIDRGTALQLSDDPFQAGLFYHARRAGELFAIATEAIGRDRFVGVLAAQSANPWTGEQVATFDGGVPGAAVLAIAPYIDGFGDPETAATVRELSVRQLLRRMRRVVDGPLRDAIAANRSVAVANGLALVAYEGGQHLVGVRGAENDARLTRLFVAANRSSGMARLYRHYLQTWSEASRGGLLNHYVDVSAYGKWGSWGAREDQLDGLRDAPKARALRRWMEHAPG